jgi:hypothetical protein
MASWAETAHRREKNMKTYTTRFVNCRTYGIICTAEVKREKFTKREFDQIISFLFEAAAKSYLNDDLRADVFECDADEVYRARYTPDSLQDKHRFTVTARTTDRKPEIYTTICVNDQPIRVMTVAD